MRTTLIPVAVAALACGVSIRTMNDWCAQDKVGPITHPPGCTTKKLIDRAELEKFVGPIDERRMRRAWSRYRRTNHVVVS